MSRYYSRQCKISSQTDIQSNYGSISSNKPLVYIEEYDKTGSTYLTQFVMTIMMYNEASRNTKWKNE